MSLLLARQTGGPAPVTLTQAPGLTTAEALGLVDALLFTINGTATGVPSSEAFDVTALALTLTEGTNMTSAVAIGTSTLVDTLTQTAGVSTVEAFGASNTSFNQTQTIGITSAEAFGSSNAQVNLPQSLGITTTEAFGVDAISGGPPPTVLTQSSGIVTGELAYPASLAFTINALSLGSDEAFGASTLGYTMTLHGLRRSRV